MNKQYKKRECENCLATLPSPTHNQKTVDCEYCGTGYNIDSFEEVVAAVVVGHGAVAQGNNAVAVASGGVIVGGTVAGSIITGGSVITGNVVTSGDFVGGNAVYVNGKRVS